MDTPTKNLALSDLLYPIQMPSKDYPFEGFKNLSRLGRVGEEGVVCLNLNHHA